MAERLKEVESTGYPGLISRYENGLIEPTLMVLLQYSRLSKIPMEYLVDDRLKLPKK